MNQDSNCTNDKQVKPKCCRLKSHCNCHQNNKECQQKNIQQKQQNSPQCNKKHHFEHEEVDGSINTEFVYKQELENLIKKVNELDQQARQYRKHDTHITSDVLKTEQVQQIPRCSQSYAEKDFWVKPAYDEKKSSQTHETTSQIEVCQSLQPVTPPPKADRGRASTDKSGHSVTSHLQSAVAIREEPDSATQVNQAVMEDLKHLVDINCHGGGETLAHSTDTHTLPELSTEVENRSNVSPLGQVPVFRKVYKANKCLEDNVMTCQIQEDHGYLNREDLNHNTISSSRKMKKHKIDQKNVYVELATSGNIGAQSGRHLFPSTSQPRPYTYTEAKCVPSPNQYSMEVLEDPAQFYVSHTERHGDPNTIDISGLVTQETLKAPRSQNTYTKIKDGISSYGKQFTEIAGLVNTPSTYCDSSAPNCESVLCSFDGSSLRQQSLTKKRNAKNYPSRNPNTHKVFVCHDQHVDEHFIARNEEGKTCTRETSKQHFSKGDLQQEKHEDVFVDLTYASRKPGRGAQSTDHLLPTSFPGLTSAHLHGSPLHQLLTDPHTRDLVNPPLRQQQLQSGNQVHSSCYGLPKNSVTTALAEEDNYEKGKMEEDFDNKQRKQCPVLCVSDIPVDTSPAPFLSLAKRCGHVTKVCFLKHKNTRAFQGTAYVTFSSFEDAARAQAFINNHLFRGTLLKAALMETSHIFK